MTEKADDFLPPSIRELQKEFPSDVWWRLKALPSGPLEVKAWLENQETGELGISFLLRLSLEEARELIEREKTSDVHNE